MRFFNRRKWGMTLLAVWLIVMGVLPLLRIDIPHSGTILGLLAVAAGVLLLLDRRRPVLPSCSMTGAGQDADADELLILAKKIPDGIRRRVLECPDAFPGIAPR